MQIPRSMVDAMTEMVNATSLTAQANLRVMLEAVDWTADVATVREQLIRIMHSVCGMATDEAARIATEMYDGIRTIEMGQPLGAEPTSGREPDATEGAVRMREARPRPSEVRTRAVRRRDVRLLPDAGKSRIRLPHGGGGEPRPLQLRCWRHEG